MKYTLLRRSKSRTDHARDSVRSRNAGATGVMGGEGESVDKKGEGNL